MTETARKYLDLLHEIRNVRDTKGFESPEEEGIQQQLDILWKSISADEIEELEQAWERERRSRG